MTLWQAFLFGLIQGATEFFPVSSSAHLTILESFLQLKNPNDLIFFNLFCHLGTTLAALLYLRKEIFFLLFRSPKKILYFIVAGVPLLFFYPIATFLMQGLAFHPRYLTVSFFSTTLLLSLAAFSRTNLTQKPLFPENLKSPNLFLEKLEKRRIFDVLFLGVMQALALLPGLSRLGATLAAGTLRGWRLKETLQFSLLLAIPTVLGGTLLESYRHLQTESLPHYPPAIYWTAFLSSFVVGLIGIRLIFQLKEKKNLLFFAFYTFLMGVFSFFYFKNL